MNVKLVPTQVLKAKLESHCPTVRKVALLHVKAHGSNGRELAAQVARLLEDDQAAVRGEAVRAFLSVGRDAIDALPVILDLRSRRTADKQLARNATFLLSAVGDGATAIVPQLKADLAKPTLFELTLCALLELAPDDPEVISALLEAPFRPRNQAAGLAVEALPVAPSAVLDMWAEVSSAHIRGEEPNVRLVALEFAVELVRYRPEALRPCVLLALSRLNEKESWGALMAVRRLPRPFSKEELDSLSRLASSSLKSANSAREFLSTLDDRRAELQPPSECADEGRGVKSRGMFWARLGRDFRSDDEELSVPPLPPEQGIRTPKAKLRPLSEKERDDLTGAIDRGWAKLKLLPNADPQQIANEVESLILARTDDSKDPIALGCVFGKAIAEQTGWSWEILCHEGMEHLALVSDSRAYVHTPIEFIASELSTWGCPSRISLVFTMLAQGNLPPAEAGSLLEPYPDEEYWSARRTALTSRSEVSLLRAKATLLLLDGDRSGAIRLFEEAEALKSDPVVHQKLEELKRAVQDQ